MRTTLDIDDDVLAAVKERARAEKRTAGEVLSDLARRALRPPEGPRGDLTLQDGIPVLARGGAIVTKELVDRLIETVELEDAGLRVDRK